MRWVLSLPRRIAGRVVRGLHSISERVEPGLRRRGALLWQYLTVYRPLADGVRIRVPGVGWLALRLHPHGDNFISTALRQGQLLDAHVLEVLRSLVRRGDTVLDVGGNIGWFSVIGSRLVGQAGRVFAIEPDPLNAAMLRENLRRNGCTNVILEEVAAGAAAGVARLYHSADNAGDHQMAVVADRASWVDVAVRPLDALLAGRVARADVVKMDTQGSEVATLRGMTGLLAAHPATRMVLEFWPHGLERCGSTATELIDLLEAVPRRYWLLVHTGTIHPTTAARLRELAVTDLAPATVMHADIVAVAAGDSDGIARMTALESGGPA